MTPLSLEKGILDQMIDGHFPWHSNVTVYRNAHIALKYYELG